MRWALCSPSSSGLSLTPAVDKSANVAHKLHGPWPSGTASVAHLCQRPHAIGANTKGKSAWKCKATGRLSGRRNGALEMKVARPILNIRSVNALTEVSEAKPPVLSRLVSVFWGEVFCLSMEDHHLFGSTAISSAVSGCAWSCNWNMGVSCRLVRRSNSGKAKEGGGGRGLRGGGGGGLSLHVESCSPAHNSQRRV